MSFTGWEDIVMAIAGLVLAAGLVPTIRAGTRVPLWTCVMFVGCLTAMQVATLSLELWLTSVGLALQNFAWGWLMQRAWSDD